MNSYSSRYVSLGRYVSYGTTNQRQLKVINDNNGTVVATNATSKAKSGMYTAVGMLSTGRPVIAWYDSITDGGCLWFSITAIRQTPQTLEQPEWTPSFQQAKNS